MKTVFALLIVALTIPAFAQAAQRQACLFGESTADLVDLLDSTEADRPLRKGEFLSFSNPARIGGITSAERIMILNAIAEASGGAEQSEEESLKDFSKGDGYIRYFRHSDGRKFAAVASFPGDNEFGLIFEIKLLKNRAEQRIIRTVARIEDGDLADCTVGE